MRIFCFCLILLASPAVAIVDVHDEFYANTDVDRFSTVAIDFNGARGNKEQVEIGAASHTVFRRNNTTTLAIVEFNFEETNDETSDNNTFVHLRHSRPLSGPHGYEFLAQYTEDKFERLERRTLLGAGYRFEWKPGTEHERGLLGAGLIREREQFTGRNAQHNWRGNLFLTTATPLSLAQGASLSFSSYAQPRLDDPSDIRAIGVLSFTARMSERFSIRFGVDYEYDSDPEPGVRETNVNYSSGITYTFK